MNGALGMLEQVSTGWRRRARLRRCCRRSQKPGSIVDSADNVVDAHSQHFVGLVDNMSDEKRQSEQHPTHNQPVSIAKAS